MRILVLGAGAVGGYFGGRLLEKGEDVTFLVREKKERQIKENGLIIRSKHGDTLLRPKMIRSRSGEEHFDLIIIATKAYQLESAMKDVEPFTGVDTVIIPLLNGINHINQLTSFFSQDQIIGGMCFIESTLNEAGEIVQTSDTHELVYGEWGGRDTDRISEIESVFSGTKAEFRRSIHIEEDMWHKYLFIAALSGITALMRSAIGPIRDTLEGRTYLQQLFEEVRIVMSESGAPIADGISEKQLALLEKQDRTLKSSMLRDIEKGYSIEADHLQGYLLSLAEKHRVETPLLRLVYQHLKVYEKNI